MSIQIAKIYGSLEFTILASDKLMYANVCFQISKGDCSAVKTQNVSSDTTDILVAGSIVSHPPGTRLEGTWALLLCVLAELA